MKYNKFYFLHIGKTGGRYIKKSVVSPIVKQLHENGIETIQEYHSHSGWHSKIDDQTYVMTVLRDPAEQVVSLYSHEICLDEQGFLKSDYDKNKLTKKYFFQWLEKEIEKKNLYPNFQTKNFLCDEFYFKRGDPKSKRYVSINFNENLLKTRTDQVNLFLNNNNIAGRELEIQQKIFLDLGIKGSTISSKIEENFFNDHSRILYNEFTEQEKEMLKKYNSIDNDLYISSSYF